MKTKLPESKLVKFSKVKEGRLLKQITKIQNDL